MTAGLKTTPLQKLRSLTLAASFGLSGMACAGAQKPEVVHVNQNLDPCMKLEDKKTEDKKEGKKSHTLSTEFDNVCDESRAIERWAATRRADGKPDMASVAVALAVDVERHPSLKRALKRGLARNAMTLEEAREKAREYDIKMKEQALERARREQDAKGACMMREEENDLVVWDCSVTTAPPENKKAPAKAPAKKEPTDKKPAKDTPAAPQSKPQKPAPQNNTKTAVPV